MLCANRIRLDLGMIRQKKRILIKPQTGCKNIRYNAQKSLSLKVPTEPRVNFTDELEIKIKQKMAPT